MHYWLRHIAIRGCLVAALLILTGALRAQDDPKQHPQTPAVQTTQQEPASNIPPPLNGKKTVETDWSAPNCENPKNPNEADLCQQRRMAKAAEENIFWTKIQIGIAIAGTLFLMWNLYYARQATNAATKANEITNKMFVAEQRAWIFVELFANSGFTFEQTGAHVAVALKVTNIGKTPALFVHTNMDMILGEKDSPERLKAFCEEHRKIDVHSSRSLLAGDSYFRPWGPSISREEMKESALGEHITPIIIGCVTYQILPDQSLHQTAFIYFVDAADPNSSIRSDSDAGTSKEVVLTVGSGGFAD